MSESHNVKTPQPPPATPLAERSGWRKAFGVRAACRRFRQSLHSQSSGKPRALQTLRDSRCRRRILELGAWGFAFFFLLSALAQFTYEVTKARYVLGYYPAPNEKQMRALFEGARVQPLPDGRNRVTDAKLHSFLTNGEPQMNVLAPEAFLNQATGIANSSGHLRVETADGRFSIEGDGFQWQTNSTLFISNHVHTVVLPDLVNSKTARQRLGGPMPNLDVVSDHFQYTGDSELAVYQDHVRVAGTNLWLTSGNLSLKVPQKQLHLETIRAAQNVVLDYTNADHEKIHATGGQALYSVATDQLQVSDHPAWHTALRQGGGDELFIDRTNKIFRTTGNAWLRMVNQGKNGGGLLPQIDLLNTNAPPPTNQVVEIRSDSYEFRTNFAVFNQNVHLTQHVRAQTNKLDCGVLTVAFSGSNLVHSMVAEHNVSLQQEDKAFTAGKAVYTPTNALLVLTDKPAWRAGQRQGKGDRLFINVTNAELIVRGNASMRVPAKEITPPAMARAAQTNSKPQTAGAILRASTPDPRASTFADVFAEEYTLRRIGDRLVSYFKGGVYITHTQMNLVCASMTVNAPLDPNKGETTLVADQDVQFDLMDTKGQRHHGKGDKVVYTHSVKGGTTNDIVVLTGNPALLQSATNNATARNKTFTLDLGRGTISGSGQYVFTGSTPGFDTNKFKWPMMKK